MPINKRLNKRPADIADPAVAAEAFRLSKADWTDLYFDLYRQCFGESESGEQEIIDDAKNRIEILRLARRREA